MINPSKYRLLIFLIPALVILFSLFSGITDTNFAGVIKVISNTDDTQNLTSKIILQIRLPRVLLAFITGGILAVSGSSMQAVFRNPMVDPYIMGISSGAAFGAALAIVFPVFNIQLTAFIFGLAAVVMSYTIAIRKKTLSIVPLILSGIIINGVFTSLLTILQVWSDPFKLQSIVQWIMGSFQNAGISDIKSVIIPCTLGMVVMFTYSWKLDVISLGDDEARSVGINVTRIKALIIGAAALACSAVVSVSGVIGLYGLIIPHFVRMIFGVNNRHTVMINFTFGGSFLVIMDNISRNMGGYEIPIGVFTMLFSSPVFIYIMKKHNIGWQ